MRTTYERHKALHSHTPAEGARRLLKRLAGSATDPAKFLQVGPKEVARFGDVTVGLRYRHRGEDTLAIKDDILTKLAGDARTRKAFVTLIDENQMLPGGQGGKNTTQINRSCEIDGKLSRDPRYLLISVAALQRWAKTSQHVPVHWSLIGHWHFEPVTKT